MTHTGPVSGDFTSDKRNQQGENALNVVLKIYGVKNGKVIVEDMKIINMNVAHAVRYGG